MSGRHADVVINPDDTNSLGDLAHPHRSRSSPADDNDWTLQLLHQHRQRTLMQLLFIAVLLVGALVLGYLMHTTSQSEQQLTQDLSILQLDNEQLHEQLLNAEDALQRSNATLSDESSKRGEAETKLATLEASLAAEQSARSSAESQRDTVKTDSASVVRRSEECNQQRAALAQEKNAMEAQARNARDAALKAQADLKALQDTPKFTLESAVTLALAGVPPANAPPATPANPVTASFTPPADLLDRPLTAALPSKVRGIVVSFVHEDNIALRGTAATNAGLPPINHGQLQACWESSQSALFTPHGLEWLLVYELWPVDMSARLREWARVNGFERDPESIKDAALAEDSLHTARYLAPLPANAAEGAVRTRITFHGVVLALPRYVSAHPNRVDSKTWAPQARTWSLSLLARRAFWVAGLWTTSIPALVGPDYALKLALTAVWSTAPEQNPFEAAAAAKCLVAHDGLRRDFVEWHEGAVEALASYAQSYGLRPASAGREWCQTSWPFVSADPAVPKPTEGPVWFQPSPFLVSLRWMRSAEVRHALTYLYEDESASGYFRNGWGDVPLWPKLLCLHHDVAELTEQFGVCNFDQQWDVKPPKA